MVSFFFSEITASTLLWIIVVYRDQHKWERSATLRYTCAVAQVTARRFPAIQRHKGLTGTIPRHRRHRDDSYMSEHRENEHVCKTAGTVPICVRRRADAIAPSNRSSHFTSETALTFSVWWQWVQKTFYWSSPAVSIAFEDGKMLLESNRNRNGIGMESEWNRSGIEFESKWEPYKRGDG